MAFVFEEPAVIRSKKMVFPKTEIWLPVVEVPGREQVSVKINNAIRDAAQAMIHEQGSLEDPRAEMIGFFEVKTNEKNILSLSLFNYAYTGGAHGTTLQRSLTFSILDGHQYTLGELFKPGSNYVDRLSDIVRAQIKARDIQVFEPFGKISPDQDFYIADRSLVLYFQLYEITPYVFGFPYFPISVYEISDIVADDGPLGKMNEND